MYVLKVMILEVSFSGELVGVFSVVESVMILLCRLCCFVVRVDIVGFFEGFIKCV